MYVGGRAIDNGNGTWRYEYAIQNLNSDRAGGSFSVPIPAGVTVTNIGFAAPAYINGENISNAPWTATVANGMITWTCEPNSQSNANALRWSSLYSFRFTANTAPATTAPNVTVGVWKAPTATSTATSISAAIIGPRALAIPGDLDGNGTVSGSDLTILLNGWGTAAGDLNGDGTTDGSDMAVLLGNWNG
jgi:hypothetical protein